jgi:hypothetical protein
MVRPAANSPLPLGRRSLVLVGPGLIVGRGVAESGNHRIGSVSIRSRSFSLAVIT